MFSGPDACPLASFECRTRTVLLGRLVARVLITTVPHRLKGRHANFSRRSNGEKSERVINVMRRTRIGMKMLLDVA